MIWLKESLLIALALASSAPMPTAANCDFIFRPGSPELNLDAGGNRIALKSLVELLADFNGVQGFRFVIAGATAADCEPINDCDALLVSRVNSITDAIDGASGARLSQNLTWRRRAAGELPTDILKVFLENDASKTQSPTCPYVLEINDPRLPSSASHQDWLNVSGLVEVRLTERAQIRVRTADEGAKLTVRQRLGGDERELASNVLRGQWQADKLLGDAAVTDLRFVRAESAGAEPGRQRDVAESSDDWPSASEEDAARRRERCEVRLLRRPSR